MPTYTYDCENCGRFDYIQSMRDITLAYCPKCHGNVKKIFAASPVIFNGSGFYSTDKNSSSSTGSTKKNGNTDF
jgi:putative FmdB family regulatory protein